jgi:hypothetical protein
VIWSCDWSDETSNTGVTVVRWVLIRLKAGPEPEPVPEFPDELVEVPISLDVHPIELEMTGIARDRNQK